MTMQNDTLTEPSIYHKTSFLCGEMLSLARQFHEATVRLETARVECSLVHMRSAWLDLEKICDQSTQLTGSLFTAISNEEKRRKNLNQGRE